MTNSDLVQLYAETKNQITSPNKVLILVLISELREARKAFDQDMEMKNAFENEQYLRSGLIIDYQKLKERLQSAEEALKLYADEIFYDHPNYLLMSNPPITPNWIMKDRGDKARAHFEKYQ